MGLSGSNKIKVNQGTLISLEMLTTGTPRPAIVWMKNSIVDITEDVRASVTTTRLSSILTLEKANLEDTGKYTMTASNLSGEATATVDVIVIGTPGQPEGPVNFTDISAKGCMLSWNPPKINGGSDVRYYIISKCDTSKLSWEVVNAQSETTTFRASKLVEGREYVFRICAANETGMGPYLQSLPVVANHQTTVPTAPGKPEQVRTHFNSITIKYTTPSNDGGSKIIGYHVERLKNKGSRWARCNDEPINGVQYRVTGLSEGSLYEFRVYAENVAGKGISSEISKSIECRMEAKPPGPPCVVRLTDSTITSATIVWEAPLNDNGSEVTGYVVEKKKFDRTDTVEWDRVNEIPVEDFSMLITELESEKVYEVQVRAVNKAGVGEPCECCDFVKTIERPEEPQFIINDDFKSLITLFSGKSLNLNASFQGRPIPTATWSREGDHAISSSAVISVTDSNACLLIDSVNREDTGKYVLSIENSAGVKKLKMSVNVIDISGPVGVILYKEVKSESVTLSWTEPEFTGCSDIDGYLIEKCDVLQQQWSTVASDCSRTFYRLTKLELGKTYKFRVTAINNYGLGVPRETEDSLKITHAPSAPLSLDLDEVTKTTIKISWKKPQYNGGSQITSYVVEISPADENKFACVEQISSSMESYEIIDLVENSLYDVQVRAVNELGQGDASTAVTSILTRDYTEIPLADVSNLKLSTVRAGTTLSLIVPVTGNPKPENKWFFK